MEIAVMIFQVIISYVLYAGIAFSIHNFVYKNYKEFEEGINYKIIIGIIIVCFYIIISTIISSSIISSSIISNSSIIISIISNISNSIIISNISNSIIIIIIIISIGIMGIMGIKKIYCRISEVDRKNKNWFLKLLDCIPIDIKLANVNKENIKKESNLKSQRKKYIKLANKSNFCISLIVLIVSILLSLVLYISNLMKENNLLAKEILDVLQCKCILEWMFFIFLWRAISRSYEIAVSFTKDIISSEDKKSTVTPSERIELALFSFAEIIINFTIVYYIGYRGGVYDAGIESWLLLNNKEITGLVDASIFTFLERSIGISTLTNVGNLSLVKFFQLISSMSLIYFALAGYISNVGSNKEKKQGLILYGKDIKILHSYQGSKKLNVKVSTAISNYFNINIDDAHINIDIDCSKFRYISIKKDSDKYVIVSKLKKEDATRDSNISVEEMNKERLDSFFNECNICFIGNKKMIVPEETFLVGILDIKGKKEIKVDERLERFFEFKEIE